MLTVSEVFGPTFQGEGPSAGRLASFLRLGLCNLDCSWCDTPYTWDWSGKNGPPQDRALLAQLSELDIAVDLIERAAPLVVITGGEPMLQGRHLVDLIPFLADAGIAVEIETNGTIANRPGLEAVDFNVSPKLAGSGVDEGYAREAFANYVGVSRARFKFVISHPDDLHQVDHLVERFGVDPSRVWLMPEGRSAEILIARGRELADLALERRYNFTTRLHVLLWGDERAR